jgi:hypothetical protein
MIKGFFFYIVKRLPSIELKENTPIGHLLINLRDSLQIEPQHIHFKFEFLDNHPSLSSSSQSNNDQPIKSVIFNTYFLLDSHTGIIQTAKVLDAEHWCDLFMSNSQSMQPCSTSTNMCGPIQFRVKASSLTNHGAVVYHIHFDVYIKDTNEHAPEFVDGNQTVQFNVSEEIAPIKLALGVRVAQDHDCADRSFTSSSSSFALSPLSYIIKSAMPSIFNDMIQVVYDADLALLFLLVQEPFDRERVDYIEFEVEKKNSF